MEITSASFSSNVLKQMYFIFSLKTYRFIIKIANVIGFFSLMFIVLLDLIFLILTVSVKIVGVSYSFIKKIGKII